MCCVAGLSFVIASTALASLAGPALAGDTPSAPTTTVVVDDDSDTVTVGIGSPASPRSGGESGGGSGVPTTTMPDDCTESWFTIGGRVATWLHPVTGNIMANWATQCPGVLDLEPRVLRRATPADLIPGVYGEVIVQIVPPVSSINPPERAPVGLGLWLAVEEPHEIAVTRPVGPFTVTVRAALATTTFELADGEVVICAGGGVPIDDLATTEPGPCGYVHTELIEQGDVRITAAWRLSYETTIGNGVLPPITTSATKTYCTYEIQTVGGPAADGGAGEPCVS